MPDIGRIQSTTFQALLTRLGIVRNEVPFVLRSEVSPVVLVGGEVSFVAAPTPAYGVTDWFTAGLLTAPLINVVMADTGQLPVGAYSAQFFFFGGDSMGFDIEWRNALNTANLRVQRVVTPTNVEALVISMRFNVENADERFRVLNKAAGTVAIDYQASILAKLG